MFGNLVDSRLTFPVITRIAGILVSIASRDAIHFELPGTSGVREIDGGLVALWRPMQDGLPFVKWR